MSAPGAPGAPGPRPDGLPAVLWALLVIVAALVGGLAAAALVHVSALVAVVVGVVAGGIAVAVFRPSLRAASWPPADRDAAPSPSPAPADTVVQLLPAQPDREWWNAAQGPPPPSSEAQRGPAPDLSSYLASTLIAQCPQCGAFRLDFRRARRGWDFRCESCGHSWTWQPGSPWPQVRVAPKRRNQSRPPAP